MTATLGPRAARRRFAAVTFLFWLPVGLVIPALVLVLTERGMTLTVIAGLLAVHSLSVAALELPTGGLSDVLGRRVVLAGAGCLGLAAYTLLALGTSLWPLAAAMVCMGAGRALSSGPAEAWYVDTVQAHSGPGAELRTGLARGGTAGGAALAVGTLCGGAVPWLLSEASGLGARLAEATSGLILPLSVPLLLAAALALVFTLYVLTALPEPPRPRATLAGVMRGVPRTVLEGLRLGVRDGLVRRVLLSTGTVGAALASTELLTPGRAAALTGGSASGATLFAVLACAGFACHALGSHAAPRLAAALGGSGRRAVLVSLLVSVSGMVLLGTTLLWEGPISLALAAAGYAMVYVGLGAKGPNLNDLLHHRVDASCRATALSVQSLAQQSAGALALLVVGSLPAGPLPWLLGGAALLAGATLWVRGVVPIATGTRSSGRLETVPVRQPD